MDRILLIDGSSLIYRAFYAIRHLSTKDGIPTNAVYGFLSMYYNAIQEYKPDYLAVAFDKAGKTFREEDYQAYKGHREKTPDELVDQFGILKDILEAMGVKSLDMDGYEADDIVGTLSKMAEDQGMDVICLTGDKDYLQLASDKTKIVLTKKSISSTKVYDREVIKEEYGVEPIDLIEIKGLMGDQSDNIPGVPGVGEKTALKLIKKYGSIDELYQHIDDLGGKKLKENLLDNKNLAYMSRELGEIYRQVPLEIELETLKKGEADYDLLRDRFKKLEFRSFYSKLPQEDKEVFDFTHQDLDQAGIKALKEEIEDQGSFTFKFFFNEDKYISSYPVGLAIKPLDGKIRVLIFSDDLTEDQALEELKDIFTSNLEKISFDIKADLTYLMARGLEIENYRDNMIAEYLVDPSKRSYSVEGQAKEYLDLDLKSLDELRGKGKKTKPLSEVDPAGLKDYMANFVGVSERIAPKLGDILEDRDMHQLYYDIELPLIEVLASMEYEGICVDKDILKALGDDLEDKLGEMTEKIYDLAGEKFNINSPKQLGVILFEKLGLPVVRKTKTGYSTAQDVLEKLEGKHEIIDYIEDYRSLSKLKSTYIDGISPLIAEDGKIHSSFNQHITATGRISSTEPNLQNIPIKTEEGRKIRKAFVAQDGGAFVDADYSQIELRVLAHLSEDENMLKAFKEGMDIHTKTAAEILDKDPEDISGLERSNAKAVNFGIIYGISDYGLSQDLGISRKAAGDYIDNYLATYPQISQYMKDIVKEGKEKGYVETIFHRRRYIPELASSNYNVRKFGERIALNTPIQGSAADIIKIAMINVYERLKKEGFKARLVLQVHDELIIDTPKDELEDVKKLLKETMEGAYDLTSRLIVELTTGKSWYEA